MKVGDLVRWWWCGILGMIIEIQSDGAHLVQFFDGTQASCTESEIEVVN